MPEVTSGLVPTGYVYQIDQLLIETGNVLTV